MSAADSVRDERVELAILSCLLNGARVDDVPAPPEAFTRLEYRAIFGACREALRSMHAADPVTVSSLLEKSGAGPELLDTVSLAACADYRPENLRAYVDRLLDFHQRRVGIRTAEAAIQALADPRARVDVASQQAAAVLSALGAGQQDLLGGEDVRAVLADYYEGVQAKEAGRQPKPAFLPVPFHGLQDGALPFRGFPAKRGASCLGVVAARSGMGKTAALATLCHFWVVTLKKRLGLFGLEDGTRWLVERWVARDFGMDWGDVGSFVPEQDTRSLNDMPWMPKDLADVKHGPAESYFTPRMTFWGALSAYERILDERMHRHAAGGIAAEQLLAKCRRWIDDGAEVIVVDHGLRVDYAPGRDERLDRAIGRNIDRLSDLTVQTGVPIILAWHLNRSAGDDASAPAMKDVKESGYLDATASTVLGQWRSGERTFCNVIKSRKSGAVGKVVEMAWAGQSGMMAPHLCREVDLAAEHAQVREEKKATVKREKAGI